MKQFTLFVAILLFSLHHVAAQITLPPSGDNQKSVVTQYIGTLAYVTITYNSPNVTGPNGENRAGKIWGQLVPYGLTNLGFGLNNPAPWRGGANENTTITFSHDVLVQGKPLKAGTYGLHFIVEENKPWTIIFSNNSTAWGSYFYDEKDDALRVEATPEKCAFNEWLTYEFIDRQPESATVALRWEELQLPFKIEIPTIKDIYIAKIREELQNRAGFSNQGWSAAARYALDNDVNLEEGLTWAEIAVSSPFFGEKNFNNLQLKAGILDKLGRTQEAEAVMKEAIEDPATTANQIHQYGRQLLAQGKKAEALKIFTYNFEKHKGAWPTHVGMARALSANGDYKKALEHAKKAYEQAPDKLNKDTMQAAVTKLEKGEDIN